MPRIKTAAMTPAKARILEALAGLAVGGGAGGYLASKTFQTKKPRFWLQDGQIYGRDLTPEEKKDYLKRLGKAALLSGSGAAALSLGASAIRRGHLNARDVEMSRDAFQKVFRPLDIAIRKEESTLSGIKSKFKKLLEEEAKVKGIGRSAEQLRVKYDIEQTLNAQKEAERVLEELRKQKAMHAYDVYLKRARMARDHVPWGGKLTVDVPLDKERMVQVPSRMTAEGQLAEVLGKDNVVYKFTPEGERHIQGPGMGYWLKKARGEG